MFQIVGDHLPSILVPSVVDPPEIVRVYPWPERCMEVSPCEFKAEKDSARRERTRREVGVGREEQTARLKQAERSKAWAAKKAM